MFNAKKVKDDAVAWIKNYFTANADPDTKAIVGISGGKDSAVTAALCVQALGKERVLGVLMPQRIQADIDISYKVCETLGIKFIEVNVGEPVKTLTNAIESSGLVFNNIAKFNTPARIRMATLYAISGIVGGRVANTCNLSEDWVGYATKFGDGAGDFSPLSHLTVTEVKAVGKELGLSDMFMEKTPIDGLCGMTDEENLGFTYAVLDRYIRDGICEDEAIKEKINNMNKKNLHKLAPMPTFKYE
jgi:NAD+ synthase